MDTGEAIAALGLVLAFSLLSYCSVLDWRTRRVPNRYWIVLSGIGIALLIARVVSDEVDLAYILILAPIVSILSDVYLDDDGSSDLARAYPFLKYGVAIILVVLLSYKWGHDDYFQHLLAVPAMMMVLVVLYMANIIRGGADAKALIALAIVFPFYPTLGDFPLITPGSDVIEIFFPFAFMVLVNAAIIVAVLPLFFLARNLAHGEFEYPQGLFGYKLDPKDIPGRHVWLMERFEDGRTVRYLTPKSAEDPKAEVEKLVRAGKTRIWVTPKIPFIAPITASVLFTAVVGGLLFLLIPA